MTKRVEKSSWRSSSDQQLARIHPISIYLRVSSRDRVNAAATPSRRCCRIAFCISVVLSERLLLMATYREGTLTTPHQHRLLQQFEPLWSATARFANCHSQAGSIPRAPAAASRHQE
jgi:hypothetical protein